MKNKQFKRELINKENLRKTCKKLFCIKIPTKTFFKVKIGIVENLLAAALNPKQPEKKGLPASSWPSLVNSEKWTKGKTKAWTIFWI